MLVMRVLVLLSVPSWKLVPGRALGSGVGLTCRKALGQEQVIGLEEDLARGSVLAGDLDRRDH